MKIPKLFNKDSSHRPPKETPEPQLDAGLLQRERALDSILTRRDASASVPQAPQPAAPLQASPPPANDDPLGRLALGNLGNRPAAPQEPPAEPAPAPEPQVLTAPSAPEEAAPEPALSLAPDVPRQPDMPPSLEQPVEVPQPDLSTETNALAGLEAAGEEGGGDLLDIFRDAKEETEEGTLVKELEDVAIGDLLTDIVSVSQRLGLATTVERKKPAAVVAPEDDDDDDGPTIAPTMRPAEPDLEPEPPTVAPVRESVPQQPAPAVQESQAVPVQQASPAPAPQAAPASQPAAAPQAAPAPPPEPHATTRPAAPQQPAESAAPRQQLLHVVMIGLSIALAAGIVGGSRGGNDLFAAGTPEDPTPAVLAYVHEPDNSFIEAAAAPTIAPAAPTLMPTFGPEAPAPVATPTPTPAPTPGAIIDYNFDPMAPAFYTYTVESGDSLTSMSHEFGICPDHILWNNPPRTEYTPLYVGEQLVMPGVPGIVHVAEPGDSIASLAARYSVQPEAIVAFPGNHLEPGESLRPGQRVLMPGGVPPGALLQTPEAYHKTHYESEHGLVWPYAGPITTYFGEVRPNYIHYAIDIGGLGSFGQPVVSVADGKVAFVGYEDPDYGNHVIVDHGDGRRTHYAHFEDVYVAQGDNVNQSQPLGTIGCTGASTGTHLHFELSKDGRLIDPLPLLP